MLRAGYNRLYLQIGPQVSAFCTKSLLIKIFYNDALVCLPHHLSVLSYFQISIYLKYYLIIINEMMHAYLVIRIRGAGYHNGDGEIIGALGNKCTFLFLDN